MDWRSDVDLLEQFIKLKEEKPCYQFDDIELLQILYIALNTNKTELGKHVIKLVVLDLGFAHDQEFWTNPPSLKK